MTLLQNIQSVPNLIYVVASLIVKNWGVFFVFLNKRATKNEKKIERIKKFPKMTTIKHLKLAFMVRNCHLMTFYYRKQVIKMTFENILRALSYTLITTV